jgi:hypothetical protein
MGQATFIFSKAGVAILCRLDFFLFNDKNKFIDQTASMRALQIFIPLSILLIALGGSPAAQVRPIDRDTVEAILGQYLQSHASKNILLFTNRNLFFAGEKIWFNALLVDDRTGKADQSVKNLFVDFVSDADSIVAQAVLDNSGSRTNGAFEIPVSLPTGFYWIRCFTSSQLSGDSNNILVRPVFVINKPKGDEETFFRQFAISMRKGAHQPPGLRFYPERITALPGVLSTGIIETTDPFNNPVSLQGELLNGKDSVLVRFTTNKLGLARITYLYDSAQKYAARITYDNQSNRISLPAVNRRSIQLSLGNATDKFIRGFVTAESLVPAPAYTTVLAMQHDSLFYAAHGAGTYPLTIPMDRLPAGIVKLLLFDAEKKLVAERNIFIKAPKAGMELRSIKKKYPAREAVDFQISTFNKDGRPIPAVLNIAVEDELIASVSDSLESEMVPAGSGFMLEDWLLRHAGNYSSADIDMLLATRKPESNWSQVLFSDDVFRDYEDSKKLRNLEGKIINRRGSVAAGRIVTAFAKNSHDYFIDVDTTGATGRFSLGLPQGYDSLVFSLQVTDKHQFPMLSDSIEVNGFEFPSVSTPAHLKRQFLAGNTNTVNLIRRTHFDSFALFQGKVWLKPVTVKSTIKKNPGYDESRRITSFSQILTSDKFRYGGYNALGNALLMVPGVTLYSGDISIFGPTVDLLGHITRPLIVVDGFLMPPDTPPLGFLNSLNPADIDFIEVLRGAEAAVYGSRGSAGVISINSRHGTRNSDLTINGLRIFQPVTYHVSPRFEMPDYSSSKIKNSLAPDPRSAIYWRANTVVDASGETKVRFYTADLPAKYVITITGVTAEGEPLHKRVVIENTGSDQ